MIFEERLENGLLFRTVRDENDVARYVAFNTDYNNPNEGFNTDCLIRHFPGASYADYQLIEDPHTGQIISTTCLIPWRLDYEGIPLQAAQLEQVLTRPDYRQHGLVRLQINRFMQTVSERQFDLSFIWGIPYYYRQFGYSYCLEGNTFELLPVWRIPAEIPSQPNQYILRSASVEDIPVLIEHYQASMRHLQLKVQRSPDHWYYLLEWAKFPVYLIQDQSSGQVVGYIGLMKPTGSSPVTVVESGVWNHEVGLGVLRALKALTGSEIKVCWPEQGTLANLAHLLGSRTFPGGQWLLHITDPVGFLSRIAPALEERLAASDCAGLTRDIVINLFRRAYRMCFSGGRLACVKPLGFVDSSMGADGGDLCIPPEAFTRLVFGYRSLNQLFDAWPDITVKPECQRLFEVLFPKMNAYLYSTYSYFG